MSERLFETSGRLDMHDGRVLIDNSRFAVIMGLAIDSILFAGLIGAYFVLRASAMHWPPPELLQFTPGFALASGLALFAAAIALLLAIRAQSANRLSNMRLGLLASLLALMVFLGLNGSDWLTVISAERTSHTLFGGIYFMITGIFHLHVVGAMIYIAVKFRKVLRWQSYTRSSMSIQHLLYFMSVLASIWTAIFFIVYP
jgi:cytochrome c oxidase subunit 3